MSKMKPMPSRRRRALRNCLIALLAIALYSSVSFYALTPLNAVEYAKDRSGLYDPTEVVSVQWVPEMHRVHRLYLVENEHTVALSSAILRVLGWEGSFVWAVDCSKESPIHCGCVTMSHGGNNDGERVLFYYGRVNDPNIARIELLEVHLKDSGIPPGETTEFENIVSTIELPCEEWITKNGRAYFLEKSFPSDDVTIRRYVRGYDGEGNIVHQEYISNYAGVSWG